MCENLAHSLLAAGPVYCGCATLFSVRPSSSSFSSTSNLFTVRTCVCVCDYVCDCLYDTIINSCALLVLPRLRRQRGRRLRHILLVRHIYGEQQHFGSAARDPSSRLKFIRNLPSVPNQLRDDSFPRNAPRTDRSEAGEKKKISRSLCRGCRF